MNPQEKKAQQNQERRDSAEGSVNYNIDGWANVLTGLGVRGRDKNQATTFCMQRKYGIAELDELYRADGLTRRVIDIVAEEMVRQGWEIENDPKGAVQVKLDEINAPQFLMNILRWARLYGGSVGVMDIADNGKLEEPVNEKNIYDVKKVHVYDRFSVSNYNGVIDKDWNSLNFGNPIHYLISEPRTGQNFVVHYSRILRCDWNELTPRWSMDNDGWADPLLQTIYEELKNFNTAFANCGIIIHDFVNSILKIPGLAALLATECGETSVKNRINIFNMAKSVLNTIIIDGEEDYDKKTTNIAGLSDLLDRFMLQLSAVTGIPITLLFGRSPAGLNATGDADIRNFYDMIKQKQEGKLRPMLEKLIKYILLSKDMPYGGKEPLDWKLCFVPLWQNTEEEEANIRRTVAETDALYIDRGVLSPEEVAVSRFGGSQWSMNTEINMKDRDLNFEDKDLEDYESFQNENVQPNPENLE